MPPLPSPGITGVMTLRLQRTELTVTLARYNPQGGQLWAFELRQLDLSTELELAWRILITELGLLVDSVEARNVTLTLTAVEPLHAYALGVAFVIYRLLQYIFEIGAHTLELPAGSDGGQMGASPGKLRESEGQTAVSWQSKGREE